ncbi:MAG: PA14 domain-containing protein [Chitinophagales bacterium]
MKRQLLLAVCLLTSTANASAQGSYFEQAYNYVFGSCPSYNGQTLDIYEKTGDGLNATYYNGTNFDYEVLRRTDPEIYFYYSGTSPAMEVNVYQFSVVWTGYLYAPTTGEYSLSMNVDDGIRMWINDNQLIDKWNEKSASTYTQNVKLKGKQAYEIRIEYYQANKDARVELYWAYDGQNKRIVPQKYLFTNIDEPPLVLLGPSFMSPTTQQKYQTDTPNRPLQDDNRNNQVALTSSKISSPIASNMVNISIPNQSKPSSKKPAKKQMVQMSKQKTISKPVPVITAKAAPKTEQKSRPRQNQEIAASSISETSPKIKSSAINTRTISGMDKTKKIAVSTSNVSLRGDSPSSISGNLGTGQITDLKKGNTSFLATATGKTVFKPALKLKPRRSGPVILHNILFDKDRYRLKSSSYNELNALVDTLQKNQSLNVIIAGHTDFAGDPIPNKKLSESRARAVTIYLIRHGIDASRIQTKGYGGTKPLSRAPLGTDERRRNKRVEYILIEEGAKP